MKIPLLMVAIVSLASISFAQRSRRETNLDSLLLSSLAPSLTDNLLIHKRVAEVSLVLSVTDQKGRFVRGLSSSDFAIFDNAKPQTTITFFQSETDLPLDVVLVLDTSASMGERFEAEQATIAEFVHNVVRFEDSVKLLAFNTSIRAATSIHYNWRHVAGQVKKLKPVGDTALFDAVSTAALQLQQNDRPARRVIILISDGEENSSHTTLQDAVALLLKTEAVVYAVNAGDDEDSLAGRQGASNLRALADATGGAYLQSTESGDIHSAFSKIRKELRSQYALAYKPTALAAQSFHDLKVIAHNLRVRCRTGYYAK